MEPSRGGRARIYNGRIRSAILLSKGLLRDLVEVLVLALGLYVLATTTIQTVRVVGSSMYPSLRDGDLLIASKLDYRIHPVERGDVVIVNDPYGSDRDFIKRVIGLPGDRVLIRNHHVMVNGTRLEEPYVQTPWVVTGDWPTEAGDGEIVPAGNYFVLGDNRDHSSDSRLFRWVVEGDINGKAVLRFWPPQRAELFTMRPAPATVGS